MVPGYRALVAVALLLAAACQAPGAPTGSAPAGSAPAASGAGAAARSAAPDTVSAGGQSEWERVVAAARQEGKVVAVIPPGPQYEPTIRETFGKAFPGIEVEMTSLLGGQFRQRV